MPLLQLCYAIYPVHKLLKLLMHMRIHINEINCEHNSHYIYM